MSTVCKKCLLLEAGEKKSYATIRGYLDNLSEELKVSEEEYKKRLDLCRACTGLISGMCLECGCYVEVRAALKDKHCPGFGNKKW